MKKKKISHETIPLFRDELKQIPPDKPGKGGTSDYVVQNKERIRRWASKGILFGTSSWKYPGWKGQVYNKKYSSKKAFNQDCLTEYSELFPTVCADFALYSFPDEHQMQVIHDTTTDDFKISLKVTDRFTIKKYPNLPRHGAHAGKENPDFLNVQLFEDAFLKPVTALRKKQGPIIFEFSTFYPNSGVDYEQYVEMLDSFLSRLPKGYEFAVEARNKDFLTEEYLKMLASHGVAHTLNSWTRMPPIIEQLQISGVLSGKFSVARALLKPGRSYQEAVKIFQPYEEIKEEYPELRLGLAEAAQRCIADGKTLYAYVNNRAEGNSPKTIEGILDTLDNYPVKKL